MAVQEDSTTTSESTVTGRRIALVIGVNDAPGYGKAPLKYASDDAKDIAKVLQKFCGFELLEPPLLNEQATTERIKKAVRRLARGRSDEDFLLLYFSGHGHPMMFESLDRRDIYLVSQDFDVTELDQDEEAHLSMRWLRDKFYIPTQAGRVLLILDCCYAGDMGRTAPDPFLEELKQRINYYFGAPGKESGARSGGLRWALTATGHNATTKEENGHGLMTGPLLLALQGKISEARNETGQVSIHRVYEYLHEALPFDQKPSLSGDAAGRLCILASYPERAIKLRANRSPSIAHRHPNSYLPFYRDDLFQERPGEFERLETLLFNRANKQYSVRQPLVAVTGMWGVGKSGLAKELAYRYKDRFPDGIFWMSATGNEVSWEEQFAELALHTRYLPPDDDPSSNSDYKRQRALYFCEYLADHKDALLILDNVEDPERVTSFLPELFGKEPSCTILYTSQIQFVPHTVKHHDVERLPEPLALSLLLATTRPDLFKQIEEGCSSAECQAASTVCHVVGYLPLALIHLRGLLKHDDQISLARLAEVLRQRSADIIKACFEAFRLSWNRVSNEHAKSLFKLACFFPEASPIPLWLLGLAAGLGERSDIVDPLGKAYRDLRNVSLLEKLSNDLVRLHPLVRQFGQRLVEEDGDAGKALRIEAGQRLVKELTDLGRLEEWARRMGYWRCLEQVRIARDYLELLGEEERGEPITWIERWLGLESSLLATGFWWPQVLPELFYQQLFNRAVEQKASIVQGKPPEKWLRQGGQVGVEDQSQRRIIVGHTAGVTSVAFSSDGKHALTGSHDGTARLWDAEQGRELVRFVGHTAGVTSVAFSVDGKCILTGSNDKTALLWDIEQGQVLMRFAGHTNSVSSVTFSPDSRFVLTGSDDGTARLWDTVQGQESVQFAGTGAITSVAFSSEGKRVLTGAHDGTAQLWEWNVEQGRELMRFTGHTKAVSSVVFAPNDKRVLTGAHDGTARLWDVEQGQALACFVGHTGAVTSVAFSPDGKHVLTGSDDVIARLWDIEQGQALAHFAGIEAVSSIVFAPNGKHVLTGSDDGTARLWDAESSQALARFVGHTAGVTSVAFASNGKRVLTGSYDKTAWLWDVESGQALVQLEGHTEVVRSVAFAPDGKRVLTGSYDGTARLWDAESGQTLTRFSDAGEVTSVAFSPDGKRVLTGSGDGIVRLWDVESGQALVQLEGHTEVVRSVAFAPDGKRVLTGSDDRTARLWNAESGRELVRLEDHKGEVASVVFAPDGYLMVTCDNLGNVYFWHAEGAKMGTILGLYVATYEISTVYWQNTRHVLLADKGELRGRPNVYRLQLEGMW